MSDDARQLTPGRIQYKDRNGKPQVLYFQFNPENLSRSRAVTVSETEANEKAEIDASLRRGGFGRKFTLTPARWQIADLKVRIDASKPIWTAADKLSVIHETTLDPKESPKPAGYNTAQVKDAIRHLEALVEPGAVPSENEAVYGFQQVKDPPPVEFFWGSVAYVGFVTNVTINETQFTYDLVPMRIEATLSLTLISTIRQEDQGKTGGKK